MLLIILAAAVLDTLLTVAVLVKMPPRIQPKLDEQTVMHENDVPADMAEKRFTEGVLNVLNYENPAGREHSI